MDLFLNEAHNMISTCTCTQNMCILPYTHTLTHNTLIYAHVCMHVFMYVCMFLSVSVGMYILWHECRSQKIYCVVSCSHSLIIICSLLKIGCPLFSFYKIYTIYVISQGSLQRKWSLMTEYKIHSPEERLFVESLNDLEITFPCDYFTVRSSRKCVTTSECLHRFS